MTDTSKVITYDVWTRKRLREEKMEPTPNPVICKRCGKPIYLVNHKWSTDPKRKDRWKCEPDEYHPVRGHAP